MGLPPLCQKKKATQKPGSAQVVPSVPSGVPYPEVPCEPAHPFLPSLSETAALQEQVRSGEGNDTPSLSHRGLSRLGKGRGAGQPKQDKARRRGRAGKLGSAGLLLGSCWAPAGLLLDVCVLLGAGACVQVCFPYAGQAGWQDRPLQNLKHPDLLLPAPIVIIVAAVTSEKMRRNNHRIACIAGTSLPVLTLSSWLVSGSLAA